MKWTESGKVSLASFFVRHESCLSLFLENVTRFLEAKAGLDSKTMLRRPELLHIFVRTSQARREILTRTRPHLLLRNRTSRTSGADSLLLQPDRTGITKPFNCTDVSSQNTAECG
jgi:hypothetical protein